jgi:hypothetical protein
LAQQKVTNLVGVKSCRDFNIGDPIPVKAARRR